MDIKELKINHIVQIREENKRPMVCSIISISENSVDVEIIGKNDETEMLYQVPISSIFHIDLLEYHILSLGFKQQNELKYELPGYAIYSLIKNGKEILIVKTDRFHLLKWNGNKCKYIVDPPLLTLHNLQSEISMNSDKVEKVDKKTFKKLSLRYQAKVLIPTAKQRDSQNKNTKKT